MCLLPVRLGEGSGYTHTLPAMLPGMDSLWNTHGLTPVEQAAHLAKIRSAIRAAYEELGFGLQAALAAAITSDLPAVAKALGVPPDVAVRMATDPDMPDVALLRRALKIVRRRPVGAAVVLKINEAWHVTGASDRDISKIVNLLLEVADGVPMDSEIWTGATADDKIVFHQAVTYARSL